jgi:hypothetical protein
MPSSGNCSTAICRSRRWQSSLHRPMKPGPSRSQPPHDHASYQTNCGVIGTIAKRSTAPSQSSPAAVWRCAGGAGLDGGEHGRSTITDAIRREIRTQFHRSRRTNRCFNYITNLQQLDGRDHGIRCIPAQRREWVHWLEARLPRERTLQQRRDVRKRLLRHLDDLIQQR